MRIKLNCYDTVERAKHYVHVFAERRLDLKKHVSVCLPLISIGIVIKITHLYRQIRLFGFHMQCYPSGYPILNFVCFNVDVTSRMLINKVVTSAGFTHQYIFIYYGYISWLCYNIYHIGMPFEYIIVLLFC